MLCSVALQLCRDDFKVKVTFPLSEKKAEPIILTVITTDRSESAVCSAMCFVVADLHRFCSRALYAVAELMTAISKKSGVPRAELVLLFNNTVLTDRQFAFDAGLHEGAELVCLQQPPQTKLHSSSLSHPKMAPYKHKQQETKAAASSGSAGAAAGELGETLAFLATAVSPAAAAEVASDKTPAGAPTIVCCHVN